MSNVKRAALISLILFGVLALIVACGTTGEIPGLDVPDDDAEIYQVFSAVIDHSLTDEVSKGLITVSDTTYINGSKPFRLERRLSINREYELVNETTLRSDFDSLTPDTFRKTYPRFTGLFRLKSITFNEKHDRAWVDVEFIMCPTCGFGASADLQKDSGKWRVINWVDHWES